MEVIKKCRNPKIRNIQKIYSLKIDFESQNYPKFNEPNAANIYSPS
jgi:hypothetical protein